MERNLEDTNNWDFESAEPRPPVRGRRSIVSVAFPSEDFQKVVKYADAFGMKLSEFIREAALEKAQPGSVQGSVVFAGGSSACVFLVETKSGPVTRAASYPEPELVISEPGR